MYMDIYYIIPFTDVIHVQGISLYPKCYYFADEHERLRDMHTMRHHSDVVIIGTMIIVRQQFCKIVNNFLLAFL